MRQKEKSRASNFFRWIRAAFSLVVVMALTWISGILIFDDKLKVFAYIYPVLIGFQGFFIFLIFVVLSKTVREAYRKLWKVKVNESKLLSKVFKSPSLSSNMASNSNGKVSKYTLKRDCYNFVVEYNISFISCVVYIVHVPFELSIIQHIQNYLFYAY